MQKTRVYRSHVETALQQLLERTDELDAHQSVREIVCLPMDYHTPDVLGVDGISLCFVRKNLTSDWNLDLTRHSIVDG